jgi:hypothetical protein
LFIFDTESIICQQYREIITFLRKVDFYPNQLIFIMMTDVGVKTSQSARENRNGGIGGQLGFHDDLEATFMIVHTRCEKTIWPTIGFICDRKMIL